MPKKSVSALLERLFWAQLNLAGQNTRNCRHQKQPRLSQHWCQSHRCKESKSVALFTLAYPEHLGAAGGAYALGCRSAIFHGYFFGVLHFSFGFAFHAISFHLCVSFNRCFVKSFAPWRAQRIRV